MEKMTKLSVLALAALLTTVGCTKKRTANFPDEYAEQVFAISDFGGLDASKQSFTLSMDAEARELNQSEQAKAAYEKGVVRIDANQVQVPQRLKFMFNGLEIPGATGAKAPLVFAVDRDFVTAYKVVTNPKDMSILEKQIASFPAQVAAEIALQKANSQKEALDLKSTIQKNQMGKVNALKTSALSQYLVPIFKYRVLNFGIVERVKNELREQTSILKLRKTEWSRATHIQLSNNMADRLLVGMDPSQKENLEEIFVADKINNQIMTAGDLANNLKISTILDENTKVLTQISGSHLNILEIVSLKKARITDQERESLRLGGSQGRIAKCSALQKAQLTGTDQNDCVVILRYQYEISYVKARLPEVSIEGTRSNNLIFEPIRGKDSVGLIQIARGGAAKRVVSNGLLDPRNALKISDIKGKEFFLRRTAEQISGKAPMIAGMSGPTLLVKFVTAPDRLTIQRTDSVLPLRRDKRENDLEPVMSFHAKYFREVKSDDSGNPLTIPQYEETPLVEEADYVEIDWRESTIPAVYSPFDFYDRGCIGQIADTQIRNLDQRMQNGILNFSMAYTATMVPSNECLNFYKGRDSYGDNFVSAFEATQIFQERVSLVVNDKKADVAFAPAIPFSVQNFLGYGLFTTGQLNPSPNGLTGREGQEVAQPLVHDFRNGKVIDFVIGGLPEAEGRYLKIDGETIDLQQLYTEISQEVFADWNRTLHYAFKGTNLDRQGDYLRMTVNGANGSPKAFLGDLDKRFIWWEETVTDSLGILGVAQPSINPRSSIVLGGQVMMYPGNFRKSIEYNLRDARLSDEFEKKIEDRRLEILKEFQNEGSQTQPNPTVVGLSAETDSSGVAVNNVLPKNLTDGLKNQLNYNSILNQSIRSQNSLYFPKAMTEAAKKQINQFAKNAQRDSEKFKSPESPVTADENLDKLFQQQGKMPLYRILQKARHLDPGTTEEEFRLIVMNEMLEATKTDDQFGYQDRLSIENEISRLGKMVQLEKKTRGTPNCFYMGREQLFQKYASDTYRNVLKNSMKMTLAHEMGHFLGLTHNFKGTSDKDNFKFAFETDTNRPASTVMDYTDAEDDYSYGAPGPYDAFALRAGYTGMIQGLNGTGDVPYTKIFVAAGNQWTNVTKSIVRAAGIKPYRYCSDAEVGWEPLCARHDRGTNAEEVAQNIVKSLDRIYQTTFQRSDRLVFNYGTAYSVLGWAESLMFEARQFLDEGIYLAAIERDQSDFAQSHIRAALVVYQYFINLIHNPTDNIAGNDPSGILFMKIPYQVDGKTKKDVSVIYKKSLNHIIENDTGYRSKINTIGIESLKNTAIQLLAMKGNGNPRYTRYSLNVSFADFEKWVLQMKPEDSLIFESIYSILTNHLTPALLHPEAGYLEIPGTKAESTSNMKFASALSGIISLENGALDPRANFASLFKVAANRGPAPKDRTSVARGGSIKGSSMNINYFATDRAIFADRIVREAAGFAPYIFEREDIITLMKKIIMAQVSRTLLKPTATASDRTRAEQGVLAAKKDLVTKLKEMGLNRETLVFNSGMDLGNNPIEKVVDIVSGTIDNNFSGKNAQDLFAAAAQIIKIIMENPNTAFSNPDVRSFMESLKKLKAINTNNASIIPLVGLATAALVDFTQKIADANPDNFYFQGMAQVMSLTAADENMEEKYNELMGSLDLMQRLTRYVSPEYSNN